MFVVFLQYFYSIITILFLIFGLKNSKRKNTLKEKIKYWVCFGFLYNLFSLSVVLTFVPLYWFNFYLELIGILIVYFSLVCISSLAYIIIAIVDYKIKKYKSIFIAVSFVLEEILRSIFIFILFFGKGSVFGLHFTSWSIGDAFFFRPFVELAYPFGIFSLTFFLVFIISLFIYENKKTKLLGITFVTIIYLLITFFVPQKNSGQPLTIANISTNNKEKSYDGENVPVILKIRKEKLLKIVNELSIYKPDIILFPEGTRFIHSLQIDELNNLKKDFPNTIFFDGEIVNYKDGLIDNSVVYDFKNKLSLRRGKWFMMPFGDYIPYIFRPIFLLADKESFLKFEKNHNYISRKENPVFNLPIGKLGTLICSEVFSFSSLYATRKSDLIFVQSQLNDFHENIWAEAHYLIMLKINASTARTKIIVSANSMPSIIVNEKGKILYKENIGSGASVYIVDKEGAIKIK